MIIAVIIFFIIILYGTKATSFNVDYISRETTKKINGIFVYLIVISHFSSYIQMTSTLDLIYLDMRIFLSQLVVTTFLFYSGFGIMESIKKKSDQFTNTLPRRSLSLLIKLDIAIIIFIIFGLLIGREFTLQQILLSFIGWSNVGNSNWYIFIILVLYLMTYLIFKHFKNNYIKALFILFIFSSFLICILSNIYPNDSWWYNTILCYNAGMIFSLYEKRICSYLKNSFPRYIIILLGLIISFLICKINRSNLLIYELHGILFSLIITFISMKLILNSKILVFLGNHVFSIYILQRIPMVLGTILKLNYMNNLLYFLFSLILTVIFAYYFDIYTNKIVNSIFSKLLSPK